MLKQLNNTNKPQNEWPCLFCDEWRFDIWH